MCNGNDRNDILDPRMGGGIIAKLFILRAINTIRVIASIIRN